MTIFIAVSLKIKPIMITQSTDNHYRNILCANYNIVVIVSLFFCSRRIWGGVKSLNSPQMNMFISALRA